MTFFNPITPGPIEQVTLEPTSFPEKISPSLNIGQILPITVLQNFQNGQGVISLQGELVPATLPPNAEAGSQLFVKVVETLDKTVLKILDSQESLKNSAATIFAEITKNLADDLLNLIKSPGNSRLPAAQSFSLPQLFEQTSQTGIPLPLKDIITSFRELLSSLPTLSQLTESPEILRQLLALTQGTLGTTLKDNVQALQTLLSHNGVLSNTEELPTPFLALVGKELEGILREAVANNQGAAKDLHRLFEVLSKAIAEDTKGIKTTEANIAVPKNISLPEKKLIESLLSELKQADLSLPEFKTHLEAIVRRLSDDPGLVQKKAGSIPPALSSELHQVYESFKQLVHTQEVLNQLNPLMQALGEPALLFFPFLFQGTVFQNEINILSRMEKKEDYDHENFSGETQNSEKNTDLFQRIQLHVPLPALGRVEVDIAHRSHEIFVRFTLPDSEASSFLSGHLPTLVNLLRSRGFEKAELTSGVGVQTDIWPLWATELYPETSVVA